MAEHDTAVCFRPPPRERRHKDADGVWRVLFDDGIEPRPATAEEVRAFDRTRGLHARDGRLTSR